MKSKYISEQYIKVTKQSDLFYLEVYFGGPVRRWPLKDLVYADIKDIVSHHMYKEFYFRKNLKAIYTNLLNPNTWK